MKVVSLISLLALACTHKQNDAPTDTDDTETGPFETGEPGEFGDAMVELNAIRPVQGVVHIMDMDVSNETAYLAAYRGILRLDVSDPNDLQFLDNPGENKLYWSDVNTSYLMVSGREPGVRLVNLGNDGNWSPGAKYRPADAYPEGVSMGEAVAFVALQSKGVAVLTLPSMAEQLRIDLATNAVDVLVNDGVLYISDRDKGLVIVDISDVSNPKLLGEVPLSTSPQQLLFSQDHIFIAASSNIAIVDVSSPSAPVLRVEHPTHGLAQRLDKYGDLLAIANWHDTRVYDVSTPEAPKIVAVQAVEDASMSVDIDGDVVYVGDWDVMRSYAMDSTLESPEITFDPTLTLTGGPGSLTQLLSVRNDGNRKLHVDGIVCDNEAMAVSPSSFELTPDQTQTLTLTMDVENTSPQSVTCALNSDDVDEPNAPLDLQINPSGLGVGDPAPDFNLPDLDGEFHTLSQHLGKVVMISIFSSL